MLQCTFLDKHPDERIHTFFHIDRSTEEKGFLDQRQSVFDELGLSCIDELEDSNRIATDYIGGERRVVLDN